MPDSVKLPLWVFETNPGNRSAKRQQVNSAAISDDGRLIVAGTFYHDYFDSKHPQRNSALSDFFLYCFERDQADPRAPQPKYTWRHQSREGIYWIDISGDGSMVAGGGQNFVVAYRTSDGAQVLDASTRSRTNQVVLSHDGGVLAAASDRLYVFKYDGQKYVSADVPFETPNPAYSVSMSSDGKRICFSNYGPSDRNGAKARIYFLDLKEVIHTYTETEAYSHCVKMDRAGRYFVSGGGFSPDSPSTFALMFESDEFVRSGAIRWQQRMPGIVYNLFVDDQGRVAAVCNSGNDAGYVMLYDDSGTPLWRKQVERNPNSTTIGGRYVTVATGHPNGTPGYFYLLSIETGATVWRCAVAADMNWPMAISRDGTGIVGGSDNQQIFYFQP